MRITIDLSPAVHHHAGLGRYSQELLAAMLHVAPANDYTVFYNSPRRDLSPEAPLDQLPRRTLPLSNKPWRMSVLLAHFLGYKMNRWLKPGDVFHATDHLLPPLACLASVFTLHDLIYLFYPEYHLPLNRWYLTLMMPRFLQTADRVIVVSENTRLDAVRLMNLPADKTRVIYEGVNPAYHPIADRAELERVRTKYHLPDRLLLYFGTIEPRKNLLVLLEAYQALLRANANAPRLVIAGRKGWLYQPVFDRVRELGLDAQVHFTDWVDEADAPALMNLADVFVFPSLYEGFGLPPLEAMACGIPVICSNASSLPEIMGEAGILFEPHDTHALVQAMSRVLENEGTRQALRKAGLEQAQKFSWERAARETLQVYEEAVGRKLASG